MAKETEWNKRFNIGVDSIDNAHRKLFSIVRKLVYLDKKENNGQWACAEGIKYFKSYAIEHFTDEEAYMQSIGYKGYEMHKRLHDEMRYKTLPALEKDLTKSNYSEESIHHFLGICLGWLAAHIMIEDLAITGKISNRWKENETGKDVTVMEHAVADTIEKIFKLRPEIVSEHYSGDYFGNSIADRLKYRTKDGKYTQIYLVFEEHLILYVVSSMLNMPLNKMDRLVADAVKEISQHMAEQIGMNLGLYSRYQLESNHIITMEQFRKTYYLEYFDYSFLFNTGNGYFAFCVEQV